MARKTSNRAAKLYQRGVSLKEAHRPALALIDPTNENVGIRYLMQWALNSGALAPFLNSDGSAPVPPHSAKQLDALRIAALKAAYDATQARQVVTEPTPDAFAGWEDDSPTPPGNQVATPTRIIDADGYEPDDEDIITTPVQVAPAPANTGYKPATDAEMKATMQAWEQSLK